MNMRFPLSEGTAPRVCATQCARKKKGKEIGFEKNLVRIFFLLQFYHLLKKHLIDLVLFCLGRRSIQIFMDQIQLKFNI